MGAVHLFWIWSVPVGPSTSNNHSKRRKIVPDGEDGDPVVMCTTCKNVSQYSTVRDLRRFLTSMLEDACAV